MLPDLWMAQPKKINGVSRLDGKRSLDVIRDLRI